MKEFTNIEYLSQGSEKQKKAFRAINNLKIMEILKEYNPILTGTIPIDIDIENSDLDIICEAYNPQKFEQILIKEFGKFSEFTVVTRLVDGIASTVCSFEYDGFIFEVFAQPIKSTHQNAYKHMVVESRIMKIIGQRSKQEIRALKRNGYKTEPAFGVYLRISENPYDFLKAIYEWNDNELKEYLKSVNVIV
ncbi:DUF4269 domain-containing protein [Brassicibacter mesophilus]|uniref:DUF4269 domain-containing protein n=1 Tax=Brassicibacter mesophilus TaxID=745119 RepID=UPI003D202E3D